MDVPANIVERISRRVDEMREELVTFLSDMVKVPTENPPGRYYKECAQLIGEKMREFGHEVNYVEIPPERLHELAPHGNGLPRVNVVGRIKGEKEKPLLHFNGHYDVVPAGGNWTVDPFGGVVKDGKIYGRGASDQKSGIAAQVFAIEAIRREGISLLGTVESSATPDEESGGQAGVGYLVERGVISKDKTDYCVITECLDYDKICIGHRGTLWFEVKTKGKMCHGSMPVLGINAIEKMVTVINAFNAKIRPKIEAINTAYPVMPPEARQSSLTVTVINGGAKVNVVPDECAAQFDWRLVPEQDVSNSYAELLSCLEEIKRSDPTFQYEVSKIMETEPTIVPTDTSVVKAFLAAGKAVLGREPDFSVSPGSDDQKYVVHKAGIDQCIVYGPGPLSLAHKIDEYVEVEHLAKATKIMAIGALSLLGFKA